MLIGAWGKTGINCFIMITGYFMCKSNISVHKFLKLVGEYVFYRFTCNLIFLISGYQSFSVGGFLQSLNPVRSIDKNFFSCFILFYLFIPFLNILLRNMNRKQHTCLLLLCGFLYIYLGTRHSVTMNYVSWFIVIYFIAAYIRLYPSRFFSKTRLWGLLTIGFMTAATANIILRTLTGTNPNAKTVYYYVSDANKFFAVAIGVCAFLFFKNLRIPRLSFINTVAASTFGVLCIHANSDTMRQWLWSNLLDNVGHYSSAWMPLHAIGSVMAIFTVCTLIDMARIRWIETPFFLLFDKHWAKTEPMIKEKLKKLFCAIALKSDKYFSRRHRRVKRGESGGADDAVERKL